MSNSMQQREVMRPSVLSPDDSLNEYQVVISDERDRHRPVEIISLPGDKFDENASDEELRHKEEATTRKLIYDKEGDLVVVESAFNKSDGSQSRSRFVMKKVPFTDAERKGDSAVIISEYKFDNGEWKIALPHEGGGYLSLILPDIVAGGLTNQNTPVQRVGFGKPRMELMINNDDSLMESTPSARMSIDISCKPKETVNDSDAEIVLDVDTRRSDQTMIDYNGRSLRPDVKQGYKAVKVENVEENAEENTPVEVILTRSLQGVEHQGPDLRKWKLPKLTVSRTIPDNLAEVVEKLSSKK